MTVMPGNQVKIEDVAEAAGVSVATVSRALRDLPYVATSTRERVLAVAKELSYVANPTASRLAAGRIGTGTVAVLVPMFDSWYFAKIVSGIEASLTEANVDVLLFAVRNDAERQNFLAGRGAWWQRGDALIMISVQLSDSEACSLREIGSRIVTVGSETEAFSSVSIDERSAAASAAQHFIESDHTRIGVLADDLSSLSHRVAILRLEGFRERLAQHGHSLDPELILSAGFSIDGGRECMARLLDADEPPTAVFAMSDEMALGALDELRRRGLSAPEDVAVIGFDDNDVSVLFGLTTVRQRVDTIGATAGRLVLRAMNDRDQAPEHVVAPTELILRSTA